jgi:hypothetical protein
MTRFKLFLAVFLLSLSSLAFAGGGGGKGAAPAPPPPPPEPPPTPAAIKTPEVETYKRRNRQAGAMGTGGTMITTGDATAPEAGIELGKNTLLGS